MEPRFIGASGYLRALSSRRDDSFLFKSAHLRGKKKIREDGGRKNSQLTKHKTVFIALLDTGNIFNLFLASQPELSEPRMPPEDRGS